MNEKLANITAHYGWFKLEPYAMTGPKSWRVTDQSEIDGYLEWEYFGATPTEAVDKAHAALCAESEQRRAGRE